MLVISSTELRNNMKKYLDLALVETIVIQRGKNETFVLSALERIPEADMARAVTAEELLVKVETDIRDIFRKSTHK